jgi:hypothetical protein
MTGLRVLRIDSNYHKAQRSSIMIGLCAPGLRDLRQSTLIGTGAGAVSGLLFGQSRRSRDLVYDAR